MSSKLVFRYSWTISSMNSHIDGEPAYRHPAPQETYKQSWTTLCHCTAKQTNCSVRFLKTDRTKRRNW